MVARGLRGSRERLPVRVAVKMIVKLPEIICEESRDIFSRSVLCYHVTSSFIDHVGMLHLKVMNRMQGAR